MTDDEYTKENPYCTECKHRKSFHDEEMGCQCFQLGVRAVPLFKCNCLKFVNNKILPTQPRISANIFKDIEDKITGFQASTKPPLNRPPTGFYPGGYNTPMIPFHTKKNIPDTPGSSSEMAAQAKSAVDRLRSLLAIGNPINDALTETKAQEIRSLANALNKLLDEHANRNLNDE